MRNKIICFTRTLALSVVEFLSGLSERCSPIGCARRFTACQPILLTKMCVI